MSEKDLKKQILEKTENLKPRPSWYFRAISILQISIISIFLIMGSFLLGILIWYFLSFDEVSLRLFFDLGGVFSFALLILLILIIISYMIYRQSDFPWVKNRLFIFISSILILVLLGFGFLVIARNNRPVADFFEGRKNDIDDLPLNDRRPIRKPKAGPPKVLFRGRVVQLEPLEGGDFVEITIVNPEGKKEFDISKNLFIESRLSLNDFVEVEVERPGVFRIIALKLLPKEPLENPQK